MARFTINFLVMTTFFASFALLESAMATNYGSSYGRKPTYVPTTESPPPPPSPSPSPNPETCRKITQLCPGHGEYSCCEGLTCVASLRNAGALGTCQPIPQPPASTQTCRRFNEVCEHYGPQEYNCCEGLSCVSTQTLPPVANINTQKHKLPPGVGVCWPVELEGN